MEYVEEVEELPRAIRFKSRSQFLRGLTEQFIESNSRCWHVIRDRDGTLISKDKTLSFYNQFRSLVTSEYEDKGVFIVMRNGEIYLAKEGF